MCHCVMSLLWWRWSEVVWISDGAPVLSFQQSLTSPCILSAPFPGVHGENKNEWLIVNCPESPGMYPLCFHASLSVEVGVVCFCFPLVLPFGWFEGFPALWVELLVLFGCPSVAPVGSLHAQWRCWDFFNPNLPPEDFKYGTVDHLSSNYQSFVISHWKWQNI